MILMNVSYLLTCLSSYIYVWDFFPFPFAAPTQSVFCLVLISQMCSASQDCHYHPLWKSTQFLAPTHKVQKACLPSSLPLAQWRQCLKCVWLVGLSQMRYHVYFLTVLCYDFLLVINCFFPKYLNFWLPFSAWYLVSKCSWVK